jgi:hypothetical protein
MAATASKKTTTDDAPAEVPRAAAVLKVHHLRPAPGSHKPKTRVGRGEASKGKTAARARSARASRSRCWATATSASSFRSPLTASRRPPRRRSKRPAEPPRSSNSRPVSYSHEAGSWGCRHNGPRCWHNAGAQEES